MVTIAEIEPYVDVEFGSRLGPLGFQRVSKRKWIRSTKQPIRELFVISALKGGQYSPAWGFSSGFAPSFHRHAFRRQSTERNAVMDLVIDPIDVTGAVPAQAFVFIAGYDTTIPIKQIRGCAEHFVPQALADFDHVHSVSDFCELFFDRSRLTYRRFSFDMYTQHQLMRGFVFLLSGRPEKGLESLREFCAGTGAKFEDRVLSECIRNAQAHKTA
jgi:hypothetical protein